MAEKRNSLFVIVALIIGASGLGLGVFSVVNFHVVEGPQGPPGKDGQDGVDGTNGTDGEDAPGGLILDPGEGEMVAGNITIRALIYGSEDYTVQILMNETEIGTSLPLIWNSSLVLDGWKNITVIVSDVATGEKSQDTVIIYVENINVNFRVRGSGFYLLPTQWTVCDYVSFEYGENNYFNLTTDTFIAPKDGYYLINAHISVFDIVSGRYLHLSSFINGIVICYITEWSTGVYTEAHYSDVLWLGEGSTFQMKAYTNDDTNPQVFDDGTYLTINLL